MLRIHAYGKTSVVKHKSVWLNVNGGVWSNKLFGGRWQRLVDHMEIAEGQFLIFTNLGNYELKMSIFTCMGTCLHTEYVLPTMLILYLVLYRCMPDMVCFMSHSIVSFKLGILVL